MYKRRALLLMGIATWMVFAACGDDDGDDPTTEQDPNDTQKTDTEDPTDPNPSTDTDPSDKEDPPPQAPASMDESIPGSGRVQGIFATVNGEPMAATIPYTSGFLHVDYERNGVGETVVAEAFTDHERKDKWAVWLPTESGDFGCNDAEHHDGPARFIVQGLGIHTQYPYVPEDCSFHMQSFDIQGIIEGTFSGKFGSKVVTDGSFYFDNARGGGDCSKAGVVNLDAGETGATLSILDMQTTDETALYSAPKTVRCGQNYILSNGFVNSFLLNPNASEILWKYGINAAFETEDNIFFDAWNARWKLKQIAEGPHAGCYDADFMNLKGIWCDDEVDMSASTDDEWLIRFEGILASGGDAMVVTVAGEMRAPK